MRMQSEIRTVLITDVCETGQFALDDVEGHKLAARALKLVSDTATRNGGKVVKTVRNCMMITFSAAEHALRAARIIQLALRESPVRVKSGIHIGEVITTSDDLFGDTINVAAHVLTRSGAGEVLVTGKCASALPPEHRAALRLVDTTSIPGRPEWIELHRVLSAAEIAAPPEVPAGTVPVALVLTYKGTSIRIAVGDEPFAMGREASCSLRLASALASRNHATICWRTDRFFLLDSSGNGTWIVGGNGETRHVLRGELVLEGEGTLSLGSPCEANARDLIHYRCEAASAASRPELSLVETDARVPSGAIRVAA